MRSRPRAAVVLPLLALAACGGGGEEDTAAAVCADRWAAPDNKQRAVLRDALLRSGPGGAERAAWVGPSPRRESACVAVVRLDGERRATEHVFVEVDAKDEKKGSWARAAEGELTSQQVAERLREPNARLRDDGTLEAGE